jgi:hypothetical protein
MSADVDADADVDQDVAAETPTEQIAETNGSNALRPLHELETDAAGRLVGWIVTDADDRPTVDDVVETIATVADQVGFVFESDSGFAYVALSPGIGGGWLHYKFITDDEKVAAVAEVEDRPRSDVRITRSKLDEATVKDWVHLALETGRLELVALDDLDVFDNTSDFSRTGGR